MTPWQEIEKSDRFLSANKADKIKIAEEWIETSDNELKTYDDYLPYHSRQLGEFGGEILKKIYAEPEKEEGGFWQTIKDFGQDLKAVPQEFGSGFNTTSDQIRMFGNFLQGDNEELESIYNRMNAYAPLPFSPLKTLPNYRETFGGKAQKFRQNPQKDFLKPQAEKSYS